jgi:acyl carrier protein
MQDTLLPQVQHAFQRAFHLDPRSITLETGPGDISQWDSLGHATLACSLEHEFNIRFEIDELMALEDVRAIVSVVRAKLGGTA